MDLFLQQVGGVAGLEESIERPRFALLQKACREGDFFFVVLHQLFCAWTANQASVHWLCGQENRDVSLVNNAFGIMGTVLRDNSMLGGRLLQWFANFPLPNLTVLQQDGFCRHTTRQVLDFLICISQHWAIVNHRHSMLGYPLLVSELLTAFRLFSPSLQIIVFRASRRTLGVPDHPIGEKFDEVFKADQDKHRNLDDGSFSVQFDSKAYEEYNKTLVRKYKSLMGLFQSATSSTSNIPSSHHSPSLSPLSSTLLSPGFTLPTAPNNLVRVGISQGFTPPLLSPMGTARAGPPTQTSSYPPSSTDSLIDLRQTPASTFSVPAFAPQFSPPVSHSLLGTTPAAGGVVTSPYHHPTPIQQSYFGAFNIQTQQNPQQRSSYDQLRQQQQKHPLQDYQAQQQQIQQHQIPSPVLLPSQYGGRTPAQPRATTNPRAPSLQTASSLPPQKHPVAQYPPVSRSGGGRPAPASPAASETANGMRQASLGSSSLSPQIANSVRPSYVRPRIVVPPLPQRKAAPTTDRLIPAPGVKISRQEYPHTPYEKRSVELSLHQAHLRSPKRLLREHPATVPGERHYQAVKDFALYPTPVPPQAYLYSFTFNIADAVFAKLSLDEQILGEFGPINQFQNGSLRLRVKCCNQPTTTEAISDSIWVTTETAWPDHIFMTMNDHVMTVKRKQHHSRDIPVDVTSFVQPGTNILSVSIPAQSLQHRECTPYLAVEIVEVLSHSIILQIVRSSGSRPASQTRETIQRRLAAGVLGTAGDNQELEIPNDGISIDLADPFTAMIFKVPVRGTSCSHLECFDLENWLNTRLGKSIICVCGRGGGALCVCSKEPCFVDKWKCPLCDGDARPYSLVIDEFLAEVRTQLERNDQLKTKSITVYADGSWKPNLLTDDDDSDVNSDGDGTPTTHIAFSKALTAREVIELDDD
jgi:zinc finger MIZ domain-containing protein